MTDTKRKVDDAATVSDAKKHVGTPKIMIISIEAEHGEESSLIPLTRQDIVEAIGDNRIDAELGAMLLADWEAVYGAVESVDASDPRNKQAQAVARLADFGASNFDELRAHHKQKRWPSSGPTGMRYTGDVEDSVWIVESCGGWDISATH